MKCYQICKAESIWLDLHLRGPAEVRPPIVKTKAALILGCPSYETKFRWCVTGYYPASGFIVAVFLFPLVILKWVPLYCVLCIIYLTVINSCVQSDLSCWFMLIFYIS